jgi:arylsulfatase A-like enzyme
MIGASLSRAAGVPSLAHIVEGLGRGCPMVEREVPMAEATESQNATRARFVALAGSGLGLGAATGAALGLLDGVVRLGGSEVELALLGALAWSAASALAGLAVGLACGTCDVLLGRRAPRVTLSVAALLGIAVQLVGWLGAAMPFALLFLPLGFAAAALAVRWPAGLRGVRGGASALAVVLGALGAMRALTAGGLHGESLALAALGAVVVASLGLGALAARRPRATLALLALALTGATMPAWRLLLPSAPASEARTPTPPSDGSPNVVLVVLDTTRRDHLGLYGNPRGLTPWLDGFARGATVYEDAISPAEWTVPAHASLFTGLYPAVHGASFARARWLDDGHVTLAELLRNAGYETVSLVANRYLANTNLLQGFDEQLALSPYKGARFQTAALALGWPARWVDKGASRARAELERWLAGRRDPAQPFFLFVNLVEPHAPYAPPWRERRRRLPPGVSYRFASAFGLSFVPIAQFARRDAPAPPRADVVRGLYDAEVAYQDGHLGRLFATLARRVDLDRTLVVITADHGENLGEGGRWDHAFAVNDALVRVPLVIRLPARFPAGLRVAGQCDLVDVLPTVLDVLGRPAPRADLPGRPLAPDRFAPRAVTFQESHPFYDHFGLMAPAVGLHRDIVRFARSLHAARGDGFKLVSRSDGSELLVDLSDPDETVDVSAAHPAEAARLRAALAAWRTAQSAPRAPEEVPAQPLPPEEIERLRSLGYVQ